MALEDHKVLSYQIYSNRYHLMKDTIFSFILNPQVTRGQIRPCNRLSLLYGWNASRAERPHLSSHQKSIIEVPYNQSLEEAHCYQMNKWGTGSLFPKKESSDMS